MGGGVNEAVDTGNDGKQPVDNRDFPLGKQPIGYVRFPTSPAEKSPVHVSAEVFVGKSDNWGEETEGRRGGGNWGGMGGANISATALQLVPGTRVARTESHCYIAHDLLLG